MLALKRGVGDGAGPLGAWWCPLFGPAASTMFSQCPGIFPGTPTNPICDPTVDPSCQSGVLPDLNWNAILTLGGLALLGVMFFQNAFAPPAYGRRRR